VSRFLARLHLRARRRPEPESGVRRRLERDRGYSRIVHFAPRTWTSRGGHAVATRAAENGAIGSRTVSPRVVGESAFQPIDRFTDPARIGCRKVVP
jgi:hypothetical protein